jgi:hypothetical protein
VRLQPGAPEWHREVVEGLLTQHGLPGVSVEPSELDAVPAYRMPKRLVVEPDHLRLRWARSQRQGIGSGAIAERLRGSLDLLRKVGVEIHPQSRAQSALNFHDRLNADPTLMRIGDPEFEALLDAHHHTAIDLFVITYMAWEDRKRLGMPFTREKLQLIVKGDDLDRGRDSQQRNMQFELFVAAMLRLGGASVLDGEPDLRAEIAGVRVGIAAQRLRGTNDNTLEERVEYWAPEYSAIAAETAHHAAALQNRRGSYRFRVDDRRDTAVLVRGRPPLRPLRRAAAALAGDVVAPACLASSDIQWRPPYTPFSSDSTVKSASSAGQVNAVP